MSRAKKAAGFAIVLLFYITIPLAYYLASGWLDHALHLPQLMPADVNIFLAAISFLAGLFWSSWSYSYLHFVGQGSPAEIFGYALYPTQRLVTTGPYAYTRNPMIIGMFLVLLGIAFAANSIVALVMIPIGALIAVAYIRRFEEPGLVCRFGDEYEKYRDAVPVLIPSLKPRT